MHRPFGRCFLYAIFKFCFKIRRKIKFRKLWKKLMNPLRRIYKRKFLLFFKALYKRFKLSCSGFGFCFPKGGNSADLMAFCIFCGGFKLMIMRVDAAFYILCKTGIKRAVLANKGIDPEHQISRTARTLLSSLGSPTTKPAFLKSLFALPLSREYAAQSFFASPRGYSFTILIAS